MEKFSRFSNTFSGLSWDCLKDWKPFLLLSLPGLLMVCSEWWTFETGGFVTGSVDGVQLAAYTIMLNVIGTGYIVSDISLCGLVCGSLLV